MGLDLGRIATGALTGGLSELWRAASPNRPDAPTLPQAPILNAPTLPQYPGFNPQEQQLLNQQQGYLQQGQGVANNYNPIYGNFGLVAGNIGNTASNYGNVMGNLGNVAGDIGNAAGGYGNVQNSLGGVAGNVGSLAGSFGQIAGNLGSLAGSAGTGAYNQQNQAVAGQELTNYQNSLTGNIPQNQMIAQQKAQDWEALKQQAGQLGIQLSGKDPGSAASQSTAGNQMITDFNKRYGALEQNYQLGQQQLGQYGNLQRLGLNNQSLSTQAGIYGQQASALGQQGGAYGTQAGIYGQQGQALGSQISGFGTQAGVLGQQGQTLGQQAGAYGTQANVLGQQAGALGQQGSALNNLGLQNQNLTNQYLGQTLGQYGQQTNQALSNADIANQNALNSYQQQTGQQMVNYNNALAGYNANMGLLQSGIGAAATIIGGSLGGKSRAAA